MNCILIIQVPCTNNNSEKCHRAIDKRTDAHNEKMWKRDGAIM
jgi:hypothetical protein